MATRRYQCRDSRLFLTGQFGRGLARFEFSRDCHVDLFTCLAPLHLASTNAKEEDCFAVKSATLIFLGSAEGEWPWEFSAVVFHLSKKGSFFVLLSPSAQPQNNISAKKINPHVTIFLLIIEHFKLKTSNANFYSCMGISTSFPVFLLTIRTFEGVIPFKM